MPIILAIEPDRRQAARLAGVVRQRVPTELILAETTELALDAIGKRVPDLILVPALLSPQDDAALAAALRVIAAAAHVRTLTIPALASAPKRTTREGMLAKWRRGRAESQAPDGCDPAVFAEQISAYLREAAAERAELESEPDVAADSGTVVVPDAQPTGRATPESIEQTAVGILLQQESPVVSDAWPGASVDGQPTIDLSEQLTDLSDQEPVEELFAGEPMGLYTMPSTVDNAATEAFDLLGTVLERPPIVQNAATPVSDASRQETPVPEALIEPALIDETVIEQVVEEGGARKADPERRHVEPWVSMYVTSGRMWPPLEGALAEPPPSLDDLVVQVELEPIATMERNEMAPPHVPPTAAPKRDAPDWIELVASLRQDIERRRGESTITSAPSVAARTADAGEGNRGRVEKQQKPRGKKSKPIQDEWGFFDPEQCGFSALLAKLKEITDGPQEPDACQPS